MKVIQTDNRRIRRARRRVMGWDIGETSLDLAEFYSAHKQFFYLLDRQSARLARHIGRDSFAGVPADKRVCGRNEYELALLSQHSYQWITDNQQYFMAKRLSKLIGR